MSSLKLEAGMRSKMVLDKTQKKGILKAGSSIFLTMGMILPNCALAMDTKPHKFGANGETRVTSLITSSLGYGDNVFRGSTNETSSAYLSIEPEIEAVRENAQQRLRIGYQGFATAFFESSDDNYFSNKLSADFVRGLSEVGEFKVGAAFEDGSTVRGIDITEGSNGDVEGATDFTHKEFLIGYTLGSAKVGPSIELEYNFSDIEYDNFQEINFGRDHSINGLNARLAYRYSVATSFFIDLGYDDFDYSQPFGGLLVDLDNAQKAVHVGVKWNLSRSTSGEIKIGSTDKDFDNFADPSSFVTWNAELEWALTPRDQITLVSFSKPFEQAGSGLFQEFDQTSIEWKHDFSRKLSMNAGISIGGVDFGGIGRNDDLESLSIGLIYSPTRYSELSLNYEFEEKDSNLSQFNFDTSSVFLSYAVSL